MQTQTTPESLTWNELRVRLLTLLRTSETAAQWDGMSKAERGAIKDCGGFIGGRLKDGVRRKSAVEGRSLITLDLDSGSYDPDAVAARVARMLSCAVVGYSTHSHRREAPRIRLVIPLAEELSGAEYERTVAHLLQVCGLSGYADRTTGESSRLFYWWSASADADVWSCDIAGEPYRAARIPALKNEANRANRANWANEPNLPNESDPREKDGWVGAFCRAYYPITRAMERYLPGVYVPGSRPGVMTYAAGSSTDGVKVYDSGLFVYSHHATDPAGSTPEDSHCRNAYDLVRLNLYGDTQASLERMTELCLQDESVRREFHRKSFGQLGLSEENKANKANWTNKPDEEEIAEIRGALKQRKSGRPFPQVDNVELVLRRDSRLKGRLAYNLMRQEIVADLTLPWSATAHPDCDGPQAWGETDMAFFKRLLARDYDLTADSQLVAALTVVAHDRAYHPLRSYLRELKWDGVPRIRTALEHYLGADSSRYTRELSRLMMVAAVARAVEPGVKFDIMPIIQGPQGSLKSTYVRTLAGEFFLDSLQVSDLKESEMKLCGKWLVEIGELAGLNKAETNTVKAFITRQEGVFRAPYAARDSTHPRTCIFIGTTNEETFLRDEENRRFAVVRIDPRRRAIADTVEAAAALERDRDQLWAEAYADYLQNWKGRPLVLSGAAADEQRRRGKEAHVSRTDPRREDLRIYLETLLPPDWEDYTLTDRRRYYANGDMRDADMEKHYVPRTEFCLRGFLSEYYGLTDMQKAKQRLGGYLERDIAGFLADYGGWGEPRRRRTIRYGQVMMYERSLSDALLRDAEDSDL